MKLDIVFFFIDTATATLMCVLACMDFSARPSRRFIIFPAFAILIFSISLSLVRTWLMSFSSGIFAIMPIVLLSTLNNIICVLLFSGAVWFIRRRMQRTMTERGFLLCGQARSVE